MVREIEINMLRRMKNDILNDGSACSALNSRIMNVSEDILMLIGKPFQLSMKVEDLKINLPNHDHVLQKAVHGIEKQLKFNQRL